MVGCLKLFKNHDQVNKKMISQYLIPYLSKGKRALLNICTPGAGQMYRGSFRRGLLWLPVVPTGYAVMPIVGLLLHITYILTPALQKNFTHASLSTWVK